MGFKRPEVRIFSLGPRKVLKSKDFGTFLFLSIKKVQPQYFARYHSEQTFRTKWGENLLHD